MGHLTGRFASFLLLSASVSGAWDLFVSPSQGWTHYDAKDLNSVLVLLERTTNAQGFNPYQVSQFDGHPQKALVIGARRGPWTLGLETEFWVEQFHQTEVPFDLQEAERDYRIGCDTLRAPGFTSERLYGCVDARETFNFLPITLQLSYGRDVGSHLRFDAGYGIGVMAGSATIDLRSDYFGAGAVPNDRVKIEIWPGVNAVHKLFADMEYLPWRFETFEVGIDMRWGLRYCYLPGFTIRNKDGQSLIFDKVFPEAREGANLYIRSFTQAGETDVIYVGTEEAAQAKSAQDGSRFHLVNGDFTGWFAALKLNFYWRGL